VSQLVRGLEDEKKLFLLFILFSLVLEASSFTAFSSRPDKVSFREHGALLLSSEKNNNQDGINNSHGRQKYDIRVGSTVIAGSNIPNLDIWKHQSYQVTSIYDQTDNGGMAEQTFRENLDEKGNGTRYITLYSSNYHEKPVIVSTTELKLNSVKEEVVDSLLFVLPLFGFWTALAYNFASRYSERTGVTFMDALFGR
jgi:hypothetical protein